MPDPAASSPTLIPPHPDASTFPVSPPPAWVALAFDFGRRRIGMASGDSVTRTARPLGVAGCTADGPDWLAIERRLADLKPAQLIVGIPRHADDTPGALTAAAQSFARALQLRFKLPVATVDERWSSLEAAQRLKSERRSGLRRRRVQRADIDAVSACVILERWWNQNNKP